MGMSILKIPILEDWDIEINNLYVVKRREKTYQIGFKNWIIDYLDLITDLTPEFPRFEGLRNRQVIRFIDIYSYNIKLLKTILEEKEVESNIIDILSDLIFWNSISIPEISLLISDDDINEIYINGAGSPIYIYHTYFGYIPTNLATNREGLTALLRISELIHGEGIQRLGGNLEVDIQLPGKLFRLVIDAFPLTHGDYIMVLRRLINRYYNIEELLSNGFLNREQMEIIKKVVDNIGSILIVGEPNSGKTTLLNAILKLLPQNIRKIYFEEARELEDRRIYGDHQVFYRYSGVVNSIQRGRQTIFTLRRSPDYIIIGEILTDDDIRIFLNTLLIGLRVAGTIHASNIETLLERFRSSYGENYIIPLSNLDLIILTKRDIRTGRRYVDKIYLIDFPEEVMKLGSLSQFDDELDTNGEL